MDSQNLVKYLKNNYLKKGYVTLDAKLLAAEYLLKLYHLSGKLIFSNDMIVEALAAMLSPDTSRIQKKAARIILTYSIGNDEANTILEDVAVVKDRRDPLVIDWTKRVKERDNYTCQKCGSEKYLMAHHISHWSYDIHNRVNIENGVTLCKECHALEHPEIEGLILSGGGAVE